MAYAIDESNLERQELLAEVFEPSSRELLDRITVPPGGRFLDVGCGIGNTTELLLECLPTPDEVSALDADEKLLEVARDRGGSDAGVAPNYRQGDAADLPFEDDSFDLVFARFLLTHLPDPGQAVEEFRRVCRPGGTVAVQEPDFVTVGAWPPSPAYEKAEELTDAIFDAHLGRKAWGLFREAGIGNAQVRAVVPVEGEGTTLRRLGTLSLAAIGGALVQKGALDEEEHGRLVAAARRVEDEDRDRLVSTYTVYSVWGEA